MQTRSRRPIARALRAIALAACLAAPLSCSLVQQALTRSPRPAAEGEGDFASLFTANGVRVLVLSGNPYQRGYAHGKLLAPAILDMLDAVCGSNLLLTHVRDYEREILPLMDRFDFEPDDEAELRGMLDGIRARLGDGAVFRHFKRPLTLRDLKALNTAGDWYRQACSSFAAWGTQAQDGHVWVGRNFDFLPAKAFFPYQMIVVRQRQGDRKAWATVSVPGMIGCITGINEEGVFTCVHDVFLPLRPLEEHYSPRLLVLRRLMETCSARGLEAQARPILEARRQLFDNAILLAAPVRDGTPPALVFEYNGDRSRDLGVTVRSPADNEKELSGEMIVCANHFRKRAKIGFFAHLDYRYGAMRRTLMGRSRRDEKVGFEVARRTMAASEMPITVHTVIADLDTLDFWFAAGKFLSPPHAGNFVKLPMREWLANGDGGGPAEPRVGRLEIWITQPAAGPFVAPLFWLNAPQLAVGEAARQVGLTGGRSGQGHVLVHLVRDEPPESLWAEQIGGALGGITGVPGPHYPTLEQLQGRGRYRDRPIFSVFLRPLTEAEYGRASQFLRALPDDYAAYAFGYPNCADLGAAAWSTVEPGEIPQGAFWFPVDLAVHTLALPRQVSPWLSPFGRLSPLWWRSRTPDGLARRLRALGVPRMDRRAIGELGEEEVRNALAPPRP